MGCASSKPSKSKKDNKKLNKKSKSNEAIGKVDEEAYQSDLLIPLDKNLVDQIKKNEVQVVEYISKLVQKDLNNELTKHATARTVNEQSPDLASTTLAVQNQQDNDDLIIDVSSKAISTIVNTQLPNTTLTYKSLKVSLKNWKFLCKNQTNKIRIIDLTCDTIQESLRSINDELKDNSQFDLLSFLSQHSILTPPQTPEKLHSQEEIWNQDAILMNRTKANQIARLLFLSNKARPVIHSSNRIKDAYFVNRELSDKTQVTITQEEIDEILNNSTYKNNPHITPVTGRKLDMNSDLLPRKFHEKNTEEQNAEQSVEENADFSKEVVDNLAANLMVASDFEKVTVENLTENTSESATDSESRVTSEQVVTQVESSTNQSTDTNVAVQKPQETEFLNEIVNQINNLDASIDVETSKDTERAIQDTTVTVTPPTTPEAFAENSEVDVESNSITNEVADNSTLNETDVTDESKVDTSDSKPAETVSEDQPTEDQSTEDQPTEADGKLDPTLKQELVDDRFYNNDSFKSAPPVNGTDAENDAASKIQASFKGEAVRQNTEELNNTLESFSSNMFDEALDKAATKIQSTYRGFKTRKSLKVNPVNLRKKVQEEASESNQEEQGEVSSPEPVAEPVTEPVTEPVAESVAESVTESESKGKEVSVEEILDVLEKRPEAVDASVQEPAKKNGKKKRNRKKSPKQNEQEINTPTDSPTLPPEHEQIAATKIQSTFRGFKARKDLKEQKNKD